MLLPRHMPAARYGQLNQNPERRFNSTACTRGRSVRPPRSPGAVVCTAALASRLTAFPCSRRQICESASGRFKAANYATTVRSTENTAKPLFFKWLRARQPQYRTFPVRQVHSYPHSTGAPRAEAVFGAGRDFDVAGGPYAGESGRIGPPDAGAAEQDRPDRYCLKSWETNDWRQTSC